MMRIINLLEVNLKLKKNKNNERFKTLDLGKSTIFFEKGVEVEFDSQNKTIEINQKIEGSRSYIFGGSLENFKINLMVNKL